MCCPIEESFLLPADRSLAGYDRFSVRADVVATSHETNADAFTADKRPVGA